MWAAVAAVASAHGTDDQAPPLVAVTGRTAAWLRGYVQRPRGRLEVVIERVLNSTIFPGRRRLRQVLSEIAGDRVDSVFAYLVGEWLRSHGFDPVPEYPIETPTGLVHADHALVDDQIVIECEGFGAHSRRSSLNTDAKRSNGLALRPDWRVLRMTWDRWENERDDFLAEIHTAQETQRRLLRALAASRPTSSG